MKLIFLPLLLASATLHATTPAPTIAQREAALLRRFDADGDGILSPDERATAARTLREERNAQAQQRSTSVQERVEAGQNKRDVALLQRFDANGDGVISDQERRAAEETMRRERETYRDAPNRP